MATKRAAKKATKVAAKPTKKVPGKPLAKGHDPRRGKGCPPGSPNAGRPPDWWTGQLKAGLYRPETIAQVNGVLGDSQHPAFASVLRWADERVHGKVAQPVVGGGSDGQFVVNVVYSRE